MGGKTDKADDRVLGQSLCDEICKRNTVLQVVYSSTVFFDRWRRRDLEPELCPVAGKSVPCRAKLGDVE